MIPTTPGMAPGTHWRAPGNPRLARLYNQTDALDDVLSGNAQGVHHGAFGGRSVQIPGGQYRVHPMAVNSAPMAPMRQQTGDPGLWFNQQPRPFDAQAFVAGQNQPSQVAGPRATAIIRADGGVQLRGGGQFMDPVQAANAYAAMGGKGLTYDNSGQPVLNGRTASAEDMHRANLGLRGANANAKMADIRANSRARQAWGAAQEGNMAPLMRAVGQGLIKLPNGGDQVNFGRGQRFAAEAALGMLEGLPAHQRAALIGPLAQALESGDIGAFGTAAANMGKMETRNAEVKRKARGSQTTVQPGDVEEALQFKTGAEAFQNAVGQGVPRDTAVMITQQAFPDWKPGWQGPLDYTDPRTGRVNSYLNHPAVEAFTGPGQMRSVYDMFFGKWPGDGPKKPAQQGSWQQMPQVGPVDPNGLQPIPNAPLGPSPPGAMSPMNAPGNWLEKLGHRFLNQRW